jgi:hypothetical protein
VVQTFSNENVTIRENVDLDEWYKFCIHEFSFEAIQGSVKVCVCETHSFDFGQTWSNDPSQDFKWETFQYQVVRAHQDLHFIHGPYFHPDKFDRVPGTCFQIRRRALVKFGQTTEKMTWNLNLLNIKLLELIKIKTFYIDYFSIWKSLCEQYLPNLESHTNYMKL